jgi:hypothetical protein
MWPKLFLGILIGLTPFLFLPLLTRSGSPIVWSRPDTIDGWWWQVSGRIYRPNVFAVPPSQWPGRLVAWDRFTLVQITLLVLPIVALGLSRKLSSERRKMGLLLATCLLYIIYALGYRSTDAVVFLLPGLLLLSIPLALGLKRLGWASLALPLILIALNFNSQNLSQEPAVRDNAEKLLHLAPKNAILVTPGDQTIATLWYLHFVEDQRMDLTIVDQNMFQFNWYRERLGQIDPTLLHLDLDDLDGFRQQNQELRPICNIALVSQVTITCSDPDNQIPGATS